MCHRYKNEEAHDSSSCIEFFINIHIITSFEIWIVLTSYKGKVSHYKILVFYCMGFRMTMKFLACMLYTLKENGLQY